MPISGRSRCEGIFYTLLECQLLEVMEVMEVMDLMEVMEAMAEYLLVLKA
jgi:hypothetical protein